LSEKASYVQRGDFSASKGASTAAKNSLGVRRNGGSDSVFPEKRTVRKPVEGGGKRGLFLKGGGKTGAALGEEAYSFLEKQVPSGWGRVKTCQRSPKRTQYPDLSLRKRTPWREHPRNSYRDTGKVTPL